MLIKIFSKSLFRWFYRFSFFSFLFLISVFCSLLGHWRIWNRIFPRSGIIALFLLLFWGVCFFRLWEKVRSVFLWFKGWWCKQQGDKDPWESRSVHLSCSSLHLLHAQVYPPVVRAEVGLCTVMRSVSAGWSNSGSVQKNVTKWSRVIKGSTFLQFFTVGYRPTDGSNLLTMRTVIV